MAQSISWHLAGDYFENCSCNVLCPCLLSAAPPLTSRPTEGFCNVPLAFHIDSGRYGETVLDGLNVFVILSSPGVMAEGDWSIATYIDERAVDRAAGAARAAGETHTVGTVDRTHRGRCMYRHGNLDVGRRSPRRPTRSKQQNDQFRRTMC